MAGVIQGRREMRTGEAAPPGNIHVQSTTSTWWPCGPPVRHCRLAPRGRDFSMTGGKEGLHWSLFAFLASQGSTLEEEWPASLAVRIRRYLARTFPTQAHIRTFTYRHAGCHNKECARMLAHPPIW